MKLYKKKDELVEAVQWTGGNREEIEEWSGLSCWVTGIEELGIEGNYSNFYLPIFGYLVKTKEGFYPLSREAFELSFESAEQTFEITCAYCGHKYLNSENDPTELSNHIKECKKHPIYKYRAFAKCVINTLDKGRFGKHSSLEHLVDEARELLE